MSDQSSSVSQPSNGLADVLKTGLAGAASAFTAFETANAAKKTANKVLSPATLGIIAGGLLLITVVVVIAIKK